MFSLLWAALAATEPIDIKVWHAYRGVEQDALLSLLEAYDDAHPELIVSPLYITPSAFAAKLEAAVPRGNGPEVFIAPHERIGSWSLSGIVDTTELHPTTTQALTYDGKLYGVPLTFKCLALFVNNDLIQQAPQNTNEILSIAPALIERGITPLAYQATDAYYHALWMHGFGGSVFTEEGATLSSPENIESLEFVQSLQDKKIIPEEPTSALISQLFNKGEAALVINGPWFLGEISKDIDYSVHPLPIISKTGTRAKPYLTVEGAMISAQAQHPKEATKLAEFLASKEGATARALEGKQSVATTSAYEHPKISSDPIQKAFLIQLNHSIPMPNRPEMSATWEPMARAIRRIARGTLTPKAAMITAQQEYEVYTKPPPPPANPMPYFVLAGMFVLGLFGYAGRQWVAHRKEIRTNAYAYLYVAPAALAMLVLTALPFIIGSLVSLFAHRHGEFTFVGMANFLNIVLAQDWAFTSSLSFYCTLLVTISWTVINLFFHVSIGLALAMLLREPWLKMRGFYRVLLILPWAVPNYITALIWKGMFHRQFGAINALLQEIGIEPVSWFSQFSTAFAANVVTNTWLGFPFMMVVTLGALQSIPRDLEDAASVDGATGWQRFWYITLPLIKPALLPAIVLGSVWTFNMFNINYLVSGGEPDSSTDILISDAYRWAFDRGNRYGYASAYAVLIFFILFGYSKLGNRIAGQKTI
jgi:arabinogalactan oligomer/maltooligosaccharide transport system permease protein